jgi:hypothetical protein
METTQTFEDAVLKTVLFWSDKSFRTKFNQNNGDDSPNGGMSFLLMNMVANKAQESITDEKIKLFESALTEKLLALKKENPWKWELDVDYHPCQILSECADIAGLDQGCFPCKTFTRIESDFSVKAKYQYGGKFLTL